MVKEMAYLFKCPHTASKRVARVMLDIVGTYIFHLEMICDAVWAIGTKMRMLQFQSTFIGHVPQKISARSGSQYSHKAFSVGCCCLFFGCFSFAFLVTILLRIIMAILV